MGGPKFARSTSRASRDVDQRMVPWTASACFNGKPPADEKPEDFGGENRALYKITHLKVAGLHEEGFKRGSQPDDVDDLVPAHPGLAKWYYVERSFGYICTRMFQCFIEHAEPGAPYDSVLEQIKTLPDALSNIEFIGTQKHSPISSIRWIGPKILSPEMGPEKMRSNFAQLSLAFDSDRPASWKFEMQRKALITQKLLLGGVSHARENTYSGTIGVTSGPGSTLSSINRAANDSGGCIPGDRIWSPLGSYGTFSIISGGVLL
ncbi:hypothetical protein B0H17DRAFT_1144423 [Mycena rosella]|uniref:Uncharacterized protein n=1 Tax=Mycena rosella TaxID=1033263 RepID=A0AAD7G739_MYCRO|nr:hypothetical protein B0H17DRAFT_1144423 [Mycena rosella]